jgi:hypothetical protein
MSFSAFEDMQNIMLDGIVLCQIQHMGKFCVSQNSSHDSSMPISHAHDNRPQLVHLLQSFQHHMERDKETPFQNNWDY